MSENSQYKSDSRVNILPSARITFHIDAMHHIADSDDLLFFFVGSRVG